MLGFNLKWVGQHSGWFREVYLQRAKWSSVSTGLLWIQPACARALTSRSPWGKERVKCSFSVEAAGWRSRHPWRMVVVICELKWTLKFCRYPVFLAHALLCSYLLPIGIVSFECNYNRICGCSVVTWIIGQQPALLSYGTLAWDSYTAVCFL